ncbi:MAG: TonB-dependent receptor, partial [Dechloromonas sp.]|nr:TonB-dependent receptor [Dechloromonas sp.]
MAAAESQTALPAVSVQAAPQRAADYKAEALSSPKFTQPLVDTPQTISVIKKEIVQERGATTLSEALASVPGITLQLGENGNTQTGDAIFMRGFDTSASIFVDGIRDLGFISRDTFNIEQIEVVKGASGSDFGRGASSGYVNLASKAPVGDTFTNASIAVGTADRKRLTADINRTLDIGLPGSALRLNLMAQDYGTPGRDYVRSNRWGFAPSLAFGLGTPPRTTLSYLHLEQNNRPDGGVPTYGISGYVGGSRGPAVDRTNYYGSLGDHDDVSLDMFTIRFEHDIRSGTTLRNITRLGRSEQDLLVTGVNGVTATAPNPANFTVQRVRQGRDQVNEILTNQTNLSTSFQTGFIAHTLSTGVEFIYERQKQKTPQTLNNTTLPASLQQPVANLYNPSVGDVFLTPPDKGAYTDGKTLTAAIYAFDNLKLSEQWQVNAGARVERYRTETNSASFTAQTSTAAESLTQNPQLATSDTLVSWKLAAVYKPAANGSVYAAVSTSYQPPGGNNFALSSSASSAAQPN